MGCKYVIIVPDGAADEPLAEFDNKTPLEAADTPNLDKISSAGRQGMVNNVPQGLDPGSDVAMMSLIGYDPRRYYTGRAPIEAVAQNIKLGPSDWVFRCNLVTIVDGKMADHSAGHISTEEATMLINELAEKLGSDEMRFYPGVSYRHLLVCKNADFNVQTYPPHDHLGVAVDKLLPRGKGSDLLIDLIAKSQEHFAGHDINKVRADLGENQVSSIWLWGQGKKAVMDNFKDRFGLKGCAITAVDLVRGLAKLIGFNLIEVEGATGFIDSNFDGKAAAAIKALKKYDIVLVHAEAPDEAGHQGNPQIKKKAIELIDKKVIGPVFEALQKYEQWRLLVLPDHPTPVRTGAHCADAVPFAMAGTNITGVLNAPFGETNATKSGLRIENGCEMMEYFLKI
ncbi:MAG: cofactor-independent phosphoglycerate mutase [Sedimentisphaerales bacterium]|nr:cofactor-independent phosphoglycerate mutase [Sedimentisphaerales bacterium]